MYNLTVVQNYSIADKQYATNRTITNTDVRGKEDLIQIAWSGTLTTRTSNTAGTVTTDAVSDIITTDFIDIYWIDATGAQQMCRNGDVGAVVGTVVPFTAASGTVLPAQDTVVQICVRKSFVVSGGIIGNDVVALFAGCDQGPACTVILLGTGGTVELLVASSETTSGGIAPNDCYRWLGEGTNPLAGNTVDTVHFSHNDTATPRNVRVTALLSV